MTGEATAFEYGLEDRVPAGPLILSALQHVAIIAPIGLVFPVLVAAAIPDGDGLRESIVSASLIVLGIATILLCLRGRLLGTGFLAPSVFTAAYLPASLAAATDGGLPLVMGMTIFAGLCEVGFSFLLRRFRSLVPTEIAGLAVLMIGLTLGLLGFRLIFGLDAKGALQAEIGGWQTISVGLGVLALTIVLNVWCGGALRTYAVLLGVIAGYVAALAVGIAQLDDLAAPLAEGLMRLPHLPLMTPAFDLALAPPFAIGALAASLRAMGDITTCQKINDREWVRPEFGSIERGVRADGIGTIVSGLIGSVGLNTFSGSIGLSQATRITARRVGFAIGGVFVALAFLPPVVAVAATIPLPVTGGILLFSSAFIVSNGLMIIVGRLFDARRILMVGLALVFGVSHDVFVNFFSGLPGWLGILSGSGLVVSLMIALALNAVFRIGIARTSSFEAPIGKAIVDAVERFCEDSGAAWGARRDVVQRVFAAALEATEIALAHGVPDGRFTLTLTYDEYRIDADVRFPLGSDLSPPEAEAGGELADLPLVLIRHYADDVSLAVADGEQIMRMGFDA